MPHDAQDLILTGSVDIVVDLAETAFLDSTDGVHETRKDWVARQD